jgi:hypothetical protein
MLAGYKRGPCHRTLGQARNIIIVIAVAAVLSDSDSGLYPGRVAQRLQCWLAARDWILSTSE